MAFGTPQWGVGAPGGSPSAFTRQPNTDVEVINSTRTGNRSFGQITGLDGLRLRWGGGSQGGMTNAEFKALVDAWESHAVPNAGRVSLQYYDVGSDSWVTDDAIMLRPTSRMRGSTGDGPRHFEVTIEFPAVGLP